MATNCCLLPLGRLGLAGVTPMETSVAGVTVKVTAGEVMPANAAVMEVVPTATVLAKPLVAVVLLMVAVAGVEEVHVTAVVRTWVELSE
jgi:hypothetical protein